MCHLFVVRRPHAKLSRRAQAASPIWQNVLKEKLAKETVWLCNHQEQSIWDDDGPTRVPTCHPLFFLDISPNPPKDTDGRREDSGRGWVRELQGRWPGVLG